MASQNLGGGGNSNICYFHLENWVRFPIWRVYFSNGLVQPPTWNCLKFFWLGFVVIIPRSDPTEGTNLDGLCGRFPGALDFLRGGKKWRRLVSRDGWVSYAHPINLRCFIGKWYPLREGWTSSSRWYLFMMKISNQSHDIASWMDFFFGREYSFKQFTIKIYPSKLKCWDVGRDIARFLHSKAGHVWIAEVWSHWSAGSWFLSWISIQKRWEVWEVGELVRWDISPFHGSSSHIDSWIYSWVNSRRNREIPGSYIHVHSRLVTSQFASKRCTKSKDACQSTDWICIYIPEI